MEFHPPLEPEHSYQNLNQVSPQLRSFLRPSTLSIAFLLFHFNQATLHLGYAAAFTLHHSPTPWLHRYYSGVTLPPCTWAAPLGCHSITTLIIGYSTTSIKRPTPPSLLT